MKSVPGQRKTLRGRADKREAWLDHAQHIVLTEGFDALTITRLARAADVALGALYRYFPGKDALIAELQLRAIARFDAFLADRLVDVPPGLATVIAVCRAWSAFAEADPALWALADRSVSAPSPLLDDDTARRVDEAILPLLSRLATALDAAARAGTLTPGDSALRSRALWAAVHGAAHQRKRDRITPEPYRADAVRDALIDGLLAGWRTAG